MRTLFMSFMPLVVLAWPPAAAADPPFMPLPEAVDHVVTMVVASEPGPRTESRVVTHRAGWTRIDLVQDGYRSTVHHGQANATTVTLVRAESGEYQSLDIRRGTQPQTPGFTYDSFRTGEREVFLGETCEVWNVARETGSRVAKLACVTDDGIELWQRWVGSRWNTWSAEASDVQRRMVQPSEVHPPADMLALASWIDRVEQADSTPTLQAPGDFETVMEIPGAEPTDTRTITRKTRRHHPWTYTETLRRDGSRNLAIENKRAGLSIRFEGTTAGEFVTLTMNRNPPRPGEEAEVPGLRPVPMEQKETILGETCSWFDMMPDVMDVGLAQCMTSDGIALKEGRSGRGIETVVLEAVHLDRRDVPLARVLPPRQILTPRNWGLPR